MIRRLYECGVVVAPIQEIGRGGRNSGSRVAPLWLEDDNGLKTYLLQLLPNETLMCFTSDHDRPAGPLNVVKPQY
jgi:hypothetical protein